MKTFRLFLFMAMSSFAVAEPSPVITTKSGPMKGKLIPNKQPASSVYEFTGVPFAEPPLGELRYRKPTPVKPWTNPTVLDATRRTVPCLQTLTNDGSEDCLYLSLWVPQSALDASVSGKLGQPLSTYVFIHGGEYRQGAVAYHNGSTLAGYTNMIVVAIQYRLGSLGFAYYGTEDMPGNVALWDQLEAIKWVFDNIGVFGGNNSEITIGGQSAGAASVAFHLLSPHSRKYFQRAIIESGAAISPWAIRTPQQAIKVTDLMFVEIASKFCNQTGSVSVKSSVSEKARCLRSADGTAIPRADQAPARAGFGIPFVPVIDGDFVPRDPYEMLRSGEFYKAPVLLGATKDEGSYYLAKVPQAAQLLPSVNNSNPAMINKLNLTHYHAMIDAGMKLFMSGLLPNGSSLLQSAVELQYWPEDNLGNPSGPQIVQAVTNIVGEFSLTCPTYAFGQMMAVNVSKIFAYSFSHRSDLEPFPEWMGVPHGAELAYTFGDPVGDGQKLPKGYEQQKFSKEDGSLSVVVMSYWANFVKYGDPNGANADCSWVPRAIDGTTMRWWPALVGDDCKNGNCKNRVFEINCPKLICGAGDPVHCGFKARDCTFWQEFYPNLLRAMTRTAQGSEQTRSGGSPRPSNS